MRSKDLHMHVVRLISVWVILFLFTLTAAGRAAAFGPVKLPSNPATTIIIKKKTPLDQPIEEILPVNINTTDAATLMKVPGINRTASRQIVNHRDRNGKYTNLDQLIGFSGISKENISRLQNYLTL